MNCLYFLLALSFVLEAVAITAIGFNVLFAILIALVIKSITVYYIETLTEGKGYEKHQSRNHY